MTTRPDRGRPIGRGFSFLFVALLAVGCTSTDVPAPSPAGLIEQPPPPEGLELAPDSARVDLAMPTFTKPTEITNPLFPASQPSVLLLGEVDGLPFRTEVTVLPYTRIIEWNGQAVETVVSQYMAYLGGQIAEVAYDFYAQADDGSVWYFGEDVFDFVDGVMVSTDGTWLAGRDAPAAMIMPADPQVGDVYRPENAPGLVFEEVTVAAVDQTFDGPLGEVQGGLVARELHADGGTEEKLFAPGYGEFSTSAGGDVEALALAVPTDALSGDVPADLAAITDGATSAFHAAGDEDWTAAAAAASDVQAAWDGYPRDEVPASIVPLIDEDLAALAEAVEAREGEDAQRAALDVMESGFDLQLRYRPVPEIDLARLGIWTERLGLAAAAESAGAARAAGFALDYIRDRIVAGMDPDTAMALNVALGDVQKAVIDLDYEAMTDAAAGLREIAAP